MTTKKAGCILLNDNNEVAIVYRDYLKDYSFPKGHIEGNETLIECAIRETEEETKRTPIIQNNEPIYIEKYTTKNNEDVEVYYYLAKDGGVSDNKSTDTHPTKWINISKVKKILTYNDQKNMWDSIMNEIGEK